MSIVLLTAAAVSGATAIGVILGYRIKTVSQEFRNTVLAFAAGVMLAAAIFGLILPSANRGGLLPTIAGIFLGALFLSFLDWSVSLCFHPFRISQTLQHKPAAYRKAMLFVMAIAIHNFPEGLAAGVAFGTDNLTEAILIAGGIALQNIPEGMATIVPMIAAGISPKKSLLLGMGTGAIEFFGTLIGYWAITAVSRMLPVILAFAGGTMLHVVCNEMLPEVHSGENQSAVSYSILAGFCLMMASDILFG